MNILTVDSDAMGDMVCVIIPIGIVDGSGFSIVMASGKSPEPEK